MDNVRFETIPIFHGLDRINLAKLLPSLERVEYAPGEVLFQRGDAGDGAYILTDGEAEVFLRDNRGNIRILSNLQKGECFGEMALFFGLPRTANVAAKTAVSALRLPRERYEELLGKNQHLAVHFAGVMARRLACTNAVSGAETLNTSSDQTHAIVEGSGSPRTPVRMFRVPGIATTAGKTLIALALVAVVCGAASYLLSSSSFTRNQILLLEFLLGATVFWSLNTFSYHAVAVALPVATVLTGVASPEKAFAGFSGSSWFLVLGVFAISAAIAKTGLMYRMVLLVIRRFPPSYTWQAFALAFSGLLLTPVIPSSNGRAVLVGPIVSDICETLRFSEGSKGATGLAMASLLGFGHMSFMFMNGTATCFLALGLLPTEVIATVTWSSWLKAALLLGLLFFFGTYLAILVLYHPREKLSLDQSTIQAQLKTLGAVTRQEKVAIATVTISLLGFMTQSIHHVNGAWVAMISFLILFSGRVLDEKTIRSDIDWNFMISFGALIGFGGIISASGLTARIAAELKPWLEMFIGSKVLFLVMVSAIVHLLRFALPLPAALLISLLSIMPVVPVLGINPFVIGLVVLISGNPWFLAHQNSIYMNLEEATGGAVFHHGGTLKLAVLHVVIIMMATILSVPYWRYLGLV